MWDFTTSSPNTGAKDMVFRFGTMHFNTSLPATSDFNVEAIRLKEAIHRMDIKNSIILQF
jgi:hypothetical protein